MSDVLTQMSAALGRSYRIERELGQGGMATVYLAHDLKHDRDVAIKVLHPDLGAALGAERFLSEIRTTARLQHPHILPLLDSGNVEIGSGTLEVGQEMPSPHSPTSNFQLPTFHLLYYVMPLVTGETLRARLERERQLPVDDAVIIAREVADALGYAHGLGVIHRDIKPENILLQGGHALVADFGIALAVQQAGGARMTQTGLSLGTPQYMSPEQAMGERTIDARSDIYALGAVTYEMLVGEPPFTGPSVQAIVARLVTEEPRAISVQRKAVPPAVEAAVLHALEKLPADRFATAAQFAEALVGHGPTIANRTAAATAAQARVASPWRTRFVVAAAIAVLASGVAAWAWARGHGASDRPIERRYVELGDSARLQNQITIGPSIALSSDGAMLAFVGDSADRLWIKREDVLEPSPIAGTEQASDPVFSPDNQWIAYIAGQQLRKVPVVGGPSTVLSDSAAGGYGVAWLDDGTLVYTSISLLGLRRVTSTGGTSTVALADSALHGLAAMLVTPLPHARGVLFQECASNCVTSSLHVLDFKTGKDKLLVDNAATGWYLPTGHIVYLRSDGVATDVAFDLSTLSLHGPSVPVLQGVTVIGNRVPLTWSRSGRLIYGTSSANGDLATLRYADATGAESTPDSSWAGRFNSFDLSPDGSRIAVSVTSQGAGLDIWVKQLPRGAFSRLTFSGHDRRPAWSPDGREIAFVRDSSSGGDVYARQADGGGHERRLAHLDRAIQEVTWSHDGRWLVVRTDNAAAGAGDILAIRASGDSAPVPIAATRFTELQPALSPDDHWIAYVANDDGRSQVYVRPFPTGDGSHWQVSNAGGGSPVWSLDGKTLYFVANDNRLVAAAIQTSPTFHVTGLTPLFNAMPFDFIGFHQAFALTRDGHFAFLDVENGNVSNATRLIQVDNWFADLRARTRR